MTPNLTQAQRDVLNFLHNAPRANPDADPRALSVWWFGAGPYIPEFKPQTSFLFKAPANLTPQMIDALAAAGALTVNRSADIWEITLAPDATNAVTFDIEAEFARLFAADPDPTPTDPLTTDNRPLTPDPRATLVSLAQLINDTFDREELQNLCFDLGIDYDNLLGERKETRARDLVSRMYKDGRLPELQQTLARLRPQRF